MPDTTSRTASLRFTSSEETERHEGAITEPLEDQSLAPPPQSQDEVMHEGVVPGAALEPGPGDEQPVPEHEQAEREAGADTGPLEDQPRAG